MDRAAEPSIEQFGYMAIQLVVVVVVVVVVVDIVEVEEPS